MAITLQLVYAGPHRLRYLATHDGLAGDTVTLGNDGAASPDLLTDAQSVGALAGVSGIPLAGPIRARTDGYGPIAAGALTQAQARALLLSDDAAGAVLANDLVGRCRARVQSRTGNQVWGVDADVDGQGDPVLVIGAPGAGTAIVELEFIHSVDL